jgi:hypothetical protein
MPAPIVPAPITAMRNADNVIVRYIQETPRQCQGQLPNLRTSAPPPRRLNRQSGTPRLISLQTSHRSLKGFAFWLDRETFARLGRSRQWTGSLTVYAWPSETPPMVSTKAFASER